MPANESDVEKGLIGKLLEQHVRQLDSNFKGMFLTAQMALPLMSAGGAIVLKGSFNASMGFAGSSLYSASEAAVRSFAHSWTQDLRGRDIRVNGVEPSRYIAAV